jgi:drug/metabolite transporter (DMT)-like permease
MSQRQPSGFDWLVLVFLAALWGCSFLFIKKTLTVFEPMQAAMWRMVIAWVVYLPLGAIFWSKINWALWKPLAAVAFFGSAIPNLLFSLAQRHVSSSLAGVLNSLTPLFTLIIGGVVFKMAVTTNKVLGVVLGLTGALLLIAFNQSGAPTGNIGAALLCVVATSCYAINANIVNTWLRGTHPAALASAAFMLTGWIFVIGLWQSGGWERAWTHPEGARAMLYLVYLAIVSTVGASIIYFWLLQRTSALFATSVTYLLPVTALLLGLWDGETVRWTDIAGTATILGGLYLAQKA